MSDVQTLAVSGWPAVRSTAVITVAHLLTFMYYSLLAVSCALRFPRDTGKRSGVVVTVSMFGSFAVLLTGLLPFRQTGASVAALSAGLIAIGAGYAVWALAHLGRSFSILPETRRLVTTGPYALSRHPLYMGEAVGSVGALLVIATWWLLPLMLLNVAAQLVRIRWEEHVLGGRFPEYALYASRVPRFVPRIGRF